MTRSKAKSGRIEKILIEKVVPIMMAEGIKSVRIGKNFVSFHDDKGDYFQVEDYAL